MRFAIGHLFVCAVIFLFSTSAVVADPSPVPAAVASPLATPAPNDYDVLDRVLSEPQRKMLDRDPRCRDARTATDAYVASAGKALQTGVDAMVALEKCATLARVGTDWGDFRDYAITAAAALAYAVGTAAGDERLLHRAIDDAAHVTGYAASAATVSTYTRAQQTTLTNTLADSNAGHQMGEGPPQSSLGYSHDSQRVTADSHAYGVLATNVGSAATAGLAALATARLQKH